MIKVFRVWVDVICINHADNNEKSQQVHIMASIYKSASVTLAWLGDELETVKAGLRVISFIYNEIQDSAIRADAKAFSCMPEILNTNSLGNIYSGGIASFFSLSF